MKGGKEWSSGSPVGVQRLNRLVRSAPLERYTLLAGRSIHFIVEARPSWCWSCGLHTEFHCHVSNLTLSCWMRCGKCEWTWIQSS